jgi:hypothetical protein
MMMVVSESRMKRPLGPPRDITSECRSIDRIVRNAVKSAQKAEYMERE